jgi:hypothetical protein
MKPKLPKPKIIIAHVEGFRTPLVPDVTVLPI